MRGQSTGLLSCWSRLLFVRTKAARASAPSGCPPYVSLLRQIMSLPISCIATVATTPEVAVVPLPPPVTTLLPQRPLRAAPCARLPTVTREPRAQASPGKRDQDEGSQSQRAEGSAASRVDRATVAGVGQLAGHDGG